MARRAVVALGAPIGRREDNKQRKRDALLGCGLAQFSANGYEAASIEQIAAQSDVARGTFYLYFPDKLALFDALMERFFEPLEAALHRTAEAIDTCTTRPQALAAYQSMAAQLAAVGMAHSPELLVAFREIRQPGAAGEALRTKERRLVELVVAFTETAQQKGLLTVQHPRVACLVVYGAVERLFYEVLTGHDLGDPAVLSMQVVELFGNAMGLTSRETG